MYSINHTLLSTVISLYSLTEYQYNLLEIHLQQYKLGVCTDKNKHSIDNFNKNSGLKNYLFSNHSMFFILVSIMKALIFNLFVLTTPRSSLSSPTWNSLNPSLHMGRTRVEVKVEMTSLQSQIYMFGCYSDNSGTYYSPSRSRPQSLSLLQDMSSTNAKFIPEFNV